MNRSSLSIIVAVLLVITLLPMQSALAVSDNAPSQPTSGGHISQNHSGSEFPLEPEFFAGGDGVGDN